MVVTPLQAVELADALVVVVAVAGMPEVAVGGALLAAVEPQPATASTEANSMTSSNDR